MNELPKHTGTADLLAHNPVIQVSWSANGQFIMVHFKDKVSEPVYSLFTDVFSSIYGTNVDQDHYLQAKSSSIVKWTSCPMFDDKGDDILATQYLNIIKSSPHFKDIDIIGLPEMIASSKSHGDAYCMLKLRFRDSPKGDNLNRLVNKPFTFFGWPHRTLPWVHKLASYNARPVFDGDIMSLHVSQSTPFARLVQGHTKPIHMMRSLQKALSTVQ